MRILATIALAVITTATLADQYVAPFLLPTATNAAVTATLAVEPNTHGWSTIAVSANQPSNATTTVECYTSDLTGTNYVALAPQFIAASNTLSGAGTIVLRYPANAAGANIRIIATPSGSATLSAEHITQRD